jgi:hypothetical protein
MGEMKYEITHVMPNNAKCNLICDNKTIASNVSLPYAQYITQVCNEYEGLKTRLEIEQDKRVKAGEMALAFQKEKEKVEEELEKTINSYTEEYNNRKDFKRQRDDLIKIVDSFVIFLKHMMDL